MKYEQFYSNFDGQYHMIEELEDENFEKIQKGHILCPVCKKAKLVYYHGKEGYLSTNGQLIDNHHEENCINNYNQVSNRTMMKYVDKLKKNGNIQEKLSVFYRSLFEEKIKTEDNIETVNQFLIEENEKTSEKRQTSKKTIRRKSLRFLDKTDDSLYLYYGRKVRLKLRKKEGKNFGNYYFLSVYQGNRFLCNIYLTKFEGRINEEKEYNIILFGRMNGSYGTLNLETYDSIQILEC